MTDEPQSHPVPIDEKKVTHFYNQIVRGAVKPNIREIIVYAFRLGWEARRKEEERERHE